MIYLFRPLPECRREGLISNHNPIILNTKVDNGLSISLRIFVYNVAYFPHTNKVYQINQYNLKMKHSFRLLLLHRKPIRHRSC